MGRKAGLIIFKIKIKKMKKLMFIVLSIVLAGGAMAQTQPKKAKVNEDKKELRTDIKEKGGEKKEVRKDVSHLKFKKAKADQKDVKTENKDIRGDAKNLKKEGVSHPRAKANHEIREQKEAKKKV
jgi:hypothetical protein